MILNESLLGRTVKVWIPDRDINGKRLPNKKTYVVGKCTAVGRNKYTGYMQITVNRMPIYPVKPSDVEVLD
jgi:hypothetical protein